MIKVAFYDTKEYDKPSFEQYGSQHDMQFRFLRIRERYGQRHCDREAVRIRR